MYSCEALYLCHLFIFIAIELGIDFASKLALNLLICCPTRLFNRILNKGSYYFPSKYEDNSYT